MSELKYERLRDAVRSLYYAAHWTPDRACDAVYLWTAVRDAADLERGKSPTPIPTRTPDLDKVREKLEAIRDALQADGNPDDAYEMDADDLIEFVHDSIEGDAFLHDLATAALALLEGGE